jgi:phosphoglycolate phosphatase
LDADVQRALMYFLGWYRDHKLDYTHLYPGVAEALESIVGTGSRMAVLTNKPVNISRDIDYFFQVYGGNSFELKKPHPIGIDTLREEAGAARDRTLMVGDSSVDILTARSAGVPCAGCTWGFQPETLVTHPPEQVRPRVCAGRGQRVF